MKRLFVLLVLALLVSNAVFAQQEGVKLIDFSELAMPLVDENDLTEGYQPHTPTLIDFSEVAGSRYTEEEKAQMNVSLELSQWEVELASSSQTVGNMSNSYVKPAPVREDASSYAGQTVLGVRVHFPEDPFNSWAMIEPPFSIPAYMTDQEAVNAGEQGMGEKFNGYGILKNVGVLKEISVNLLGRNFPNGLSVILEDEYGNEKRVYMGNLQFDGWRTLTWKNPNYITQVRNRELFLSPLYPKASPMVRLKGILIHRDAMQEGGDMVTYFKDIRVKYDQAVLEVNSDVDDEDIWGILSQREEDKRNAEIARLGNLQVLRYLEKQKMYQENAGAAE